MKRQALLAMILAGTLAAQAADYEYLTIEKSDGTAQSLTAVGLKITFSNGNLMATSGTESATIALSDLSRMYFSNTKEATAIDNLQMDDLQSAADKDIEIYDLQGRRIKGQIGKSSNSQMPKGIYLVKQNNKTKKVQVK